MNSFKIGDTEFGVGKVYFSTENNLLNLEINSDEEIFNKLIEEDDSKWGWALYAPKIFFRDIPYNRQTIVVDDNILDEYEVALYMMEYNDFIGTVEIHNNAVHIEGEVYIMGEADHVVIDVDVKDAV